jgi:hypothetical protein
MAMLSRLPTGNVIFIRSRVMAINWIAAFKLIPWSDVVQATPTVVRGAKDLWARTKKSKKKSMMLDGGLPAGASTTEQLLQRVTALENEQLEASALINTLAEQNAHLVAALTSVRARMRLLSALCVLLAVGVAAALLR